MNQKGLSTVLMLSFLPILLSIVLLFMAIFLVFKFRSQTQYICQTQLLKLQNQNEKTIQELFRLNPKATKLRLQLISQQAKLFIAVANLNFPAITFYKIQIEKTKAQQLLLEIQQKNILTQNQLQNQIQIIQLQNLIRNNFAELSQINFFLLNAHQFQIQSQTRSLAVEKVWSGNGAAYQRKNGFSEKQTLSVNWKYQMQSNLNWSSTQQNIEYQNACSATIEQKGLQWISNLKKVKF